jgi:hypothetical protein
MPHLTPEALARLVEESPTADERHHLDHCRGCADALDELGAQTRALRALPAIPVPAGAWEAIEAELEQAVAERRRGTVAALAEAGARIAAVVRGQHLQDVNQRSVLRRVAYVAAALVLVVGGGVTQFVVSRMAVGDGPQLLVADGRGGRITLSGSAAQLVTATLAPAPATVDEAIARLRAAELLYHRALLDYSALRSPLPPTDVVARLATLDAIVATTGAALERAPADPVINTYHLAALAERQTLLGQIQ